MVLAFFESIKYVGHLFPVAFLRIYIGYLYFSRGMELVHSRYVSEAFLAEQIRVFAPQSTSADWFKQLLEIVVIPNWQVFALVILVSHFVIACSYAIGYLVRPISVWAIVLILCLISAVGLNQFGFPEQLMIFLHFTIGWLGAGRCLGVDYYFFKKRRGLWW